MEVIYQESLEKDIKKIKDKKVLNALKKTFLKLEESDNLFEISNVKKMSGHSRAYRIRIGDYRLGIYYSDTIVTIMHFAKRGDIYKLFP
jgi:mRNA-degrading endonuclease RelE of RelBE toxin-antitoxin system